MKLAKIIQNIECKVIGQVLREVKHLSHMAQECGKNSIFFCLNNNTNNIDWAAEAINNGCNIIVSQQSVTTNKKVTQIIVANVRKTMSQMAAIFYGNPAQKLKIIGVTGTNGKTTTTHIIKHVLESKYKVGLIGTNGVYFGDKTYQTGFTTPDPILLHKILAEMVLDGVEYVVMEYSAHAIYYYKLWGIITDIIAFTNLSQDHLDFFNNMQQYFEAKSMFFTDYKYNNAIICTDDQYGQQLVTMAQNVTTCSTKFNSANIFANLQEHTTINQTFDVIISHQKHSAVINLLGEFNLQNALIAIAVCLKCNLTIEEILHALITLKSVNGRFECYSNKTNLVIIDYAHTPDGLQKVLQAANKVAGKNRVICVFGCGGNRDSAKRKIMGQVAEKYANFSIITTDNPRFEDNFDIAQDIAAGFQKNKYKIVLDRGQALRVALDMCTEGDVVLLAGKGAEDYTEVNGAKIKGSDKDLVKKVLNIV